MPRHWPPEMPAPSAILPSFGTMLIHGKPSAGQSSAAFDLTCSAARLGATVLHLVPSQADADALSNRVVDWRRARGLDVGERLRVSAVVVHGLSGPGYRTAIYRAGRAPDIVVHDLSRRSFPLDPTDGWCRDAAALATTLGCAVLTVAWCHRLDDDTVADIIVECSGRHDPVRQSAYDLRLTWTRPAGRAVDLNGSANGRIVTYAVVRDLAEAHADAA
jgi:hypothetical protein